MPKPDAEKPAGIIIHHSQGDSSMRRFVLPTLLSIAVLTASAGACQAAGGMLARLNTSFFPTAPGLPTASPLGLIAPRLSNTVSIFQFGGMRTQAGRLAGLGVIAPRISPLVAMTRMPLTPTATRMAMLTLISPRATAMVGMLKGMQSYGTSMQTTAGGLR
jgi:hypothetical protein